MKKGFTLVELAIVIVIIGLLIMGAMAARDLSAKAHCHNNDLTLSEKQKCDQQKDKNETSITH